MGRLLRDDGLGLCHICVYAHTCIHCLFNRERQLVERVREAVLGRFERLPGMEDVRYAAPNLLIKHGSKQSIPMTYTSHPIQPNPIKIKPTQAAYPPRTGHRPAGVAEALRLESWGRLWPEP